MALPVYSNGQILNGSDCNLWFMPLVAYKSADTGRTSASQVADPDLTVSVAANAVYRVDAELFFKSSSSGTGQFDWTWTFPAGTAGGTYGAIYLGGGGGVVIEDNGWNDAAHSAGAAAINTLYPVTIHGTLVTAGTAGAFTLLWGGHGAGPTVTLTARSHLVLTRLG